MCIGRQPSHHGVTGHTHTGATHGWRLAPAQLHAHMLVKSNDFSRVFSTRSPGGVQDSAQRVAWPCVAHACFLVGWTQRENRENADNTDTQVLQELDSVGSEHDTDTRRSHTTDRQLTFCCTVPRNNARRRGVDAFVALDSGAGSSARKKA